MRRSRADEFLGKRGAEIGADQQLFERYERVLVEPPSADDLGDPFGKPLRGAGKTAPETLQPAAALHAGAPISASPALATIRAAAIAPGDKCSGSRTGA